MHKTLFIVLFSPKTKVTMRRSVWKYHTQSVMIILTLENSNDNSSPSDDNDLLQKMQMCMMIIVCVLIKATHGCTVMTI